MSGAAAVLGDAGEGKGHQNLLQVPELVGKNILNIKKNVLWPYATLFAFIFLYLIQ